MCAGRNTFGCINSLRGLPCRKITFDRVETMLRKALFALLAAAAVPVAPLSAASETVEDFYRGRMIRIIVGTNAGQDYDLWARLIGRHMINHIPGKPSLIVENMPGGGHLTATNHLYNIAARDGSILGVVSRHITDSAILKVPAVRYEPEKFTWIGSPEINWRALMVRSGAGVTSFASLYEREITVGGTGAGQGVTSAPAMLRNLLGLKFKVVEGYRAAGDIWLAMERGEVDAVIQTVGNVDGARRDPIRQGKVIVLFTMEQGKVPGIDAPTVFDVAKTDEQRQVLSFFAMATELGRPVLAPPAVPADRVEALRRAFDATMTDKEFVAEANRSGYELQPQTGEQIAKRITAAINLPEDIKAKARAMYTRD